jgi:MFS family permease
MAFSFILPALSTHMVRDTPYVPPAIFGIMMALAAFAYGGQLPLCNKLLETKSKRNVIFYGIILCMISLTLCLVDPGETATLKSVYFSLFMVIFGIGLGFTLTPMMPEI